jgi:hypothetical protein
MFTEQVADRNRQGRPGAQLRRLGISSRTVQPDGETSTSTTARHVQFAPGSAAARTPDGIGDGSRHHQRRSRLRSPSVTSTASASAEGRDGPSGRPTSEVGTASPGAPSGAR